ncbi:MAG TPA: hypothetical protein VNY83_07230 [Solirubrobacterales bacterium]|jgi:hypothetical protein|nr:hypothetical protein [Solirubrobacterales bacterium]
MRARRALVPLLALLAAAALAACGGGGSSTASTTSTAATSGPSASATTPPPPVGASGRSGGRSSGTHSSSGAAPVNPNSKGSAGFVAPTGDNSIPNFGAEAASADRSRAEVALRAYLAARARGDWPAACSGLAASVRKQVQAFAGAAKGKAKGCAPLYKALSAGAPAAARANAFTHGLASLRVKGQSGFALFYGPHSQKYVMPMTSEGGKWRMTQLAPIAYPLGAPTKAP